MNKILIIDDNEINREICRVILSPPAGRFEIMEAENGYEGIVMAETEDPLLIILDIVMPGIDGYTVLRHLRDNQKTRDIPVLILTSKDNVTDIVETLQMGANDFVKKPFDSAELTVRINTLAKLRIAQLETRRYIELLESKADMLHALAEGAHDLNGMLSSMGVIELLNEEIANIKEKIPLDIKSGLISNFNFIDKLASNTQNAIEIGKSIVTSSMSMGEIISIAKSDYNLKEIINVTLGFLTNKIIKNKITVNIECPDNIVVHIQKAEWQRMILNIVKNGIEAMDKKREKEITIRALIENSRLAIEFSDSGTGIDEEKIQKILTGHFTDKKEGHGLGMDFIKKTVTKYGGYIMIKSTIDQGTKIMIVFEKEKIVRRC